MEKTTLKLAALAYSIPATLLAASLGCGDVTSNDPQPDPEDTEAPLVVETTPAEAGTGIDSKAKITIRFSEPMDVGTVLSAYESAQLPLDKVSMSWNEDLTELTVSPDAGLLYAEGTGTDLAAVSRLTYSISIGADAADLMGNPMGAAYKLSFSTKLRMFTTAALVPELSHTTLGGALLGVDVDVISGDASINNLPYRGYVSFDLASIPQGSVVESASFAARQLSVEGTPYGALGPLQTYHLTFAAMNDVFTTNPISAPGIFSMDGNSESKSIDVTPQVIDDLANRVARGDHTQYRLQFDSVSTNNEYDRAVFAKDTFEMSLVYIHD
jgi:hypothetical protein